MGMFAACPYQRTSSGTNPGCVIAKTIAPYAAEKSIVVKVFPPYLWQTIRELESNLQ